MSLVQFCRESRVLSRVGLSEQYFQMNFIINGRNNALPRVDFIVSGIVGPWVGKHEPDHLVLQ